MHTQYTAGRHSITPAPVTMTAAISGGKPISATNTRHPSAAPSRYCESPRGPLSAINLARSAICSSLPRIWNRVTLGEAAEFE